MRPNKTSGRWGIACPKCVAPSVGKAPARLRRKPLRSPRRAGGQPFLTVINLPLPAQEEGTDVLDTKLKNGRPKQLLNRAILVVTNLFQVESVLSFSPSQRYLLIR